MANEIVASTTANDQEKFLASRLLQRSLLKLVATSLCDPVQQRHGTGTTAYFVRYSRMNVPLSPLTEGVTPPNSQFSLTQLTVTMDQWGDVITLTDIVQLTTMHPLMEQVIELLSDNAQRVIDREIQIIWLANTNVQYKDGSVTTRGGLAAADKISDTVIHKARVTMVTNGAPPRGGPSGGILLGTISNSGATAMGNEGETPGKKHAGGGTDGVNNVDADGGITQGRAYIGVATPNVIADIMQAGTSLGTWAAVAMYANAKALYNAEVGTWLGVRWIESNFVPIFQFYGNNTAAVASGAAFGTGTPVVTQVDTGGTLTHGVTYFYKVTAKDVLRGFEEFVSIAHSTATGAAAADTHSFTFDFTNATTGRVYNVYFDTVQAGGTGTDATMKQVASNVAVGQIVTVTGVPTTGVTPPAGVASGVTVHICTLHAAEATNWVGLQNLEMYVSNNDVTTVADPLRQRRTIGYKFMGKAMVRDTTRILRIEVASTY